MHMFVYMTQKQKGEGDYLMEEGKQWWGDGRTRKLELLNMSKI